MNHHASQKPIPPSLKPPKKGFGVAASPMNQVKIELGIALFLGLVLWLAADSITASLAAQLLLLAGYGVTSAGWLILRARRTVQRWEEQNSPQTGDEKNNPVNNDGKISK